ncbi:phage repressor protein, putative [hydrothermal vent metagenome]|uniref:Phage repressor protein, putative n=1 Tax=hydrothermal vent metagenome TaxID=652676 RepID=A0A1W1BKN5_9ZZZZ
MRDFRTIIVRLKIYLSNDIKRKVLDKDVSSILKINQARFATMKKRNVTPYEDILLFCESENLSCNDIFFD